MMSQVQQTSLVIADDHPVVLRGLEALLGAEPEFRVLAACSDGEAAFEAICSKNPDIAVLDMRMPKLTGLEVLGRITDDGLATRVVFLTASASDANLLTAIARRAHGIVLKEAAAESLIDCLRAVRSGQRWMPDELLQKAIVGSSYGSNGLFPVLQSLTARERDVLHNVADGRSNKEIARSLGLTEGTVKLHLHNIYKKTGVTNRTALAALALRT